MIEAITTGAAQGIAEWLPVSSEGIAALIRFNFFEGGYSLEEIIKWALFLHLGTFLGALVYFRREVWNILKTLFFYRLASPDNKSIFNFLLVSTLVSGLLGGIILWLIKEVGEIITFSAKGVTALIGMLLIITALLQIKCKRASIKRLKNISLKDGVLLGIAQGVAVLPGLSRSGLTVSALLLRRFEESLSLKLSFLMSLPIVFFGNILLNLGNMNFSLEALMGLLASFLFGMATIHYFLEIARKINFGYFVFIFGVLMLASLFI